jgi:hypothetical protein
VVLINAIKMKIKSSWVVLIALFLQGCVLTKLASTPMRVSGALMSVLPGVGDGVHEAIDTAADAVDEVPL